jgi:hypothetical protein
MVDMGRIEAHNAATALVNSQLLGRIIAYDVVASVSG